MSNLEAIARRYLGVQTLETRNSDSDDFHECAVWALRAALEEAYQAGRNDGHLAAAPPFRR